MMRETVNHCRRIFNAKCLVQNAKCGTSWVCIFHFAFIILHFAFDSRLQAEALRNTPVDADQFFLNEVKPLLALRCISCHGPDKTEGGLRLDSREAVLKGGDSGPALVVGKPEQSLLVMAIKRTHKILEMPPKERLSGKDISVLERWVREGAPWPSAPTTSNAIPSANKERIGDAWTDPRNPIVQLFGGQRRDLWSLKPVKRPALPAVQQADWARNEIDRLVLARFEADDVKPPAMADARTLARRLSFDLTGLPPTPQQVRAFEKKTASDGADTAAAALVDELMGSPRFGEHFARLWLDVVRYSDSNGFDWDEFRPQAWRYRDYVVRSLNADKPFDQFIREQLAGDELIDGPPTTAAEQDDLIATGFLRLGPHDNAAKLFNEQDRGRAELLADVTETTAGAFLGLTLTCCRCHDHKYDPISQADHYRFRAFFAAMQFADDVPLDLKNDAAAIAKKNEQLEAQAKPLRDKLAATPESSKSYREELQKQIQAIEAKRKPLSHGLLMTDSGANVPVTNVLFQGDYQSPRAAVEPGILSVFDPGPKAIAKSKNHKTTGRRLTLADWIVSPQNPLTARVFVNRIWGALMGQPLVATPNDFGLAGSRPEDPALLDWLASDFVEHGWSIKRLVREIALSATYRQAPSFTAEPHFALRAPRRASAEQLRDSLLFVSGLLTSKADGPPVWPDLPPDVLDSNPAFLDDNPEKTKGWYPSPKADQYCRSLFLIQKRNTRVPLMESFDLPDNSTSCARRPVSTVAPQALTLLNSALTADVARAFAKRVADDAGPEPAKQVERAFELALERRPEKDEAAACERLLTKRSLAELCRALVNLNEFVYVD
jgi:hypothetical protein